jgi:hypothetical protein
VTSTPATVTVTGRSSIATPASRPAFISQTAAPPSETRLRKVSVGAGSFVAMTKALVLAGGGVAGIAWELGVLRGIADVDAVLAERVMAADTVVGTSAGSSVAAQMTSGASLDALFDAQLSADSAGLEVDVDVAALLTDWTAASIDADGKPSIRPRRAGAWARALATTTVEVATRPAVITERLPRPDCRSGDRSSPNHGGSKNPARRSPAGRPFHFRRSLRHRLTNRVQQVDLRFFEEIL